MQVRKQQLGLGMEQQTGSKEDIHQGCILSLCLFNLYTEYIMRNAGMEEAEAGIKIPRRNTNNIADIADMQMTPPSWQKVRRN